MIVTEYTDSHMPSRAVNSCFNANSGTQSIASSSVRAANSSVMTQPLMSAQNHHFQPVRQQASSTVKKKASSPLKPFGVGPVSTQ